MRAKTIFGLSLLLALFFALSACQGSRNRTVTGRDIGEAKCKDRTFAQSLLFVKPWQDVIKQSPKKLIQCTYGDRQKDIVAWKNGSYLVYGQFYQGFSAVNSSYIAGQLSKKLNLDLSGSDFVEIGGRHNTLWYYKHVRNETTCLYFATFTRTWSSGAGPDDLSQGYFSGRFCYRGNLRDELAVSLIGQVGHKK